MGNQWVGMFAVLNRIDWVKKIIFEQRPERG